MDVLSVLLIIPIITAVCVLFAQKDTTIKIIALTGSIIQFAYSVWLTLFYINLRNAGVKITSHIIEWFAPLHIYYRTGIDGISLVMILLTAMVVLTGTLVSWKIEKMVKEFFFLILLLGLGAYGFFISTDLFMMFFFLEIAVIPKYLLISIWGSGKKEYSAMKLALMLMFGSALVLLGILGLYFASGIYGGNPTWDLNQLAQIKFPPEVQRILYILLFTGFGVFTAMFPFHTWAPDGHSSAPTAASMFLAGISMKLGGYGCLRVATYLLPDAAMDLSWIYIILASIAIIYGAFTTMMQNDLKYMNAYSSVSHCGFVILGIAMLTRASIMGALMQMVSHGIMTALFFAAIGMIYDRTHTRQANELGGMLKQVPFIGTAFIIAGLTSLGLPGFSGFISEITIFIGSWEHTGLFYKIATLLACASIVVTAVYILRAIGKAIWGTITNREYEKLKDASWNERAASLLLIAGIVLIGIFPFLLVQLIKNDTLTIFNKFISLALAN